MKKKDDAYYPSPYAFNKYWQYGRYMVEYMKYGDWSSIISSLKYVLTGKPESRQREVRSKMGRFMIRQGSTDFQFVNYAYEKLIREYLRKEKDTFDAFIDVGACIGEYCVWLAKLEKSCYAFEPVPKNYEALVENLKLNEVADKVHHFNLGLGASEEKILFEVMDTVTGSSRANPNLKSGGIHVPIKRLDDVLTEKIIHNDTRVIMKMDVEGMELQVLQGAVSLLQRIPDSRLIYEHTFSGADNIREFLQSFGDYSYTRLDEYNVLASKKELT